MTETSPAPASPPGGRKLILVTGAGRSGTSTIAGTLHYLGMHVPLPVLKPNESNPRGFFESTWPLWFHRRLMDRAGIEQIDGRPEALALMHEAVTDETRAELLEWLTGVAEEADQIVVKDPRSSWVPQLWVDTSRKLGIDIGFVTMLRHPAEVVGSRSTHYGKRGEQLGAWNFAVMNLAGWVNQTIMAERQTRGYARAYVRYEDLLGDWRREMAKVQVATGVVLNHSLEAGVHHDVDDFIEPGLRRHALRFEDLDLPAALTEIAESLWEAGGLLAANGGRSAEADAMFDAAAEQYADLFRASAAIAKDETQARVRETKQRADEEFKQVLQRRVRAARAKGREQAAREFRARSLRGRVGRAFGRFRAKE
ncbi:sulfotransferase family protein [Nocardioides insulae]|uniref:sulfotransferase family protein n=1 Tax=Nocardioides insulae TaxID=394734 RepID=UPI00146D8981|nr:sulfotransferase [Nocardioides insulae]